MRYSFQSLCIICMLSCVKITAMTAADKEEYERRGLSQIEWEMVLDAHMPMSKLDEIQKAGISITEYFRYPWVNYGIKEQEWMRSRKAGLLESDIAAENRIRGPSEGAMIMTAFVLPGVCQGKRKQYWKSAIMGTGAIVALAYTAAQSLHDKEFAPFPLLILLPSMLWSSVDIGVQISKERNPDANRFSSNKRPDDHLRIALSLSSR